MKSCQAWEQNSRSTRYIKLYKGLNVEVKTFIYPFIYQLIPSGLPIDAQPHWLNGLWTIYNFKCQPPFCLSHGIYDHSMQISKVSLVYQMCMWLEIVNCEHFLI